MLFHYKLNISVLLKNKVANFKIVIGFYRIIHIDTNDKFFKDSQISLKDIHVQSYKRIICVMTYFVLNVPVEI